MKRQSTQLKKEMTIAELASLMLETNNDLYTKLSLKIDQKVDEAVGELAGSTARHFERVESRLDSLEEDMGIIKQTISKIRSDILNLDQRFVTHSEFTEAGLTLKY